MSGIPASSRAEAAGSPKGWIGRDNIRAALKVTMAGFGCGVYQVVNLYESTSTDARKAL